MAAKKRGLGRGLDALLSPASNSLSNTSSNSGEGVAKPVTGVDGTLRKLPIETLTRGRFQPRSEIRSEGLQELAESIRAQGVVQPIVVRAVVGGRYEIIAGERRWRAAQLAGLSEVPALIRDVSDQAAMAMALIENIQREDLSPLEEAQALKRLNDEFGLTHQQVADAVGRSRTAVSNLMRLLELSEPVLQMLQERKLDMGHARALLALDADLQREAAQQIALRGLSVRETEELVRRLQSAPPAGKPRKPAVDPDIRSLQDDLSARLGAKVSIIHSSSGKGRLVIQYHSLDELDGILNRVK